MFDLHIIHGDFPVRKVFTRGYVDQALTQQVAFWPWISCLLAPGWPWNFSRRHLRPGSRHCRHCRIGIFLCFVHPHGDHQFRNPPLNECIDMYRCIINTWFGYIFDMFLRGSSRSFLTWFGINKTPNRPCNWRVPWKSRVFTIRDGTMTINPGFFIWTWL